MMYRIYLGTLMLLGSFSLAFAQAKPDYLSLQRSLSVLRASNAADLTTYQLIAGKVNTFQDYLKKNDDKSDDDVIAVSHLTQLLCDAAKSPESAAAILPDVNKDLEIKNAYFKARMGVAPERRGLVTVTVTTSHNGSAVLGLVVYCNPYRWVDNKQHAKTFGKLSTPTDASMFPGLYRCVATRDKDVVAGQRDVEIGLDGSDHASVEIPVKP